MTTTPLPETIWMGDMPGYTPKQLLAYAAAECAARDAEIERLLGLLDRMFSQYENGTPCYDDPDGGSYIGPAFRLDDADFDDIVEVLNKYQNPVLTAFLKEGKS